MPLWPCGLSLRVACFFVLSLRTVQGQSLASNSVTLSPAAYVTGNTPTSIAFSTTLSGSGGLSSSDTITITSQSSGSSFAIWSSAPQSVTCSFTVGGSDSGEFTGGFTVSDTATFVATAQTSVPNSAVVVFTCTSNIAALATAGTTVSFSFVSSVDTTAVTGVTGWTTEAASLKSNSVTLSPASYVVGNTPTNIAFAMTTSSAGGLSAGNKITITSQASGSPFAAWSAAASVTCTFTVGGADGGEFTSGFATTDTATFEATVQSAKTVAANAAVAITCTDNLAALSPAGSTVTFSFVSTVDNTAVTGVTGYTVVADSLSSNSVTLTPTTYVTGSTPTSIVFATTTSGTGSLSAGNTIIIAAKVSGSPSAVWAAAASVSCTFTVGGTDGGEFTGGFTASDTATLVATVQSSKTVANGAAVVFTCSSNLGTLAATGSVVTFSFQSTVDSTAATGVTGWTTIADSLSSNSVTLSPVTYQQATTPTSITFATSISGTGALSAGNVITITSQASGSPTAIWAAATGVTCTFTVDGVDSGEFNFYAADTATFTATVKAGKTVANSAAVVITCTSNLATLATSGTTVTFSYVSSVDSIAATGITGYTTTAGALSSNSVTLASPSLAAETAPTSIAFATTLTGTGGLSSGQTITITSQASGSPFALWSAAASVTCTFTVNGADGGEFTGGFATTDTATFVATAQAGGVGNNAAVVITCTSNLASLATAGTTVTFGFVSTTDNTPVSVSGWTTLPPRLTSNSVSLSPASYTTGATPSSITFATTLSGAGALSAGNTITITSQASGSPAAVWIVPNAVTCTFTVGGADNGEFTNGFQATDTATFVATVQPTKTVANSAAVVITCTDNLTPLAVVATVVTFTFVSALDSTAYTSVTGWTTAPDSLKSNSVALDPATYGTGTTPTSITFATTLSGTGALIAGETITITSQASGGAAAIWAAATVVTCTFTVNGADNGEFTTGFSTSDTATFVAQVQAGKTVANSAAVVFTCTSNLATHASAGTTVMFTFASTVDSVAVSSVSGYTTTAGSLSSNSVVVSPTTYNAGSTPTSITFSATTSAAGALVAGNAITITSQRTGIAPGSTAIWAAATSVTCSSTVGGSDGGEFAGGFSAPDTSTLQATVAAGKTVGNSAALVFTCTSNLGVYTTAASTITFTFTSTADNTPVSGVTGWTTTAAGAGSDPTTRFGNVESEFQLPPYTLTTLVASPDLIIKGSVFEGGGSYEQWFNHLVLMPPEDDRYLEIKIKPNLHLQNASTLPRNEFTSLDIHMGYGQYSTHSVAGKVLVGYNIPTHFLEHQIAVRRLRRSFVQVATIGKFHRECVDIAGRSMHLYICSSPASEYYGNLHHLALKYAHLDIMFMDIVNLKTLTGLLPELWGVQPMSGTTRSYVKKVSNLTKEDTEANITGLAFAGGPSMQDSLKACSAQNGTGLSAQDPLRACSAHSESSNALTA